MTQLSVLPVRAAPSDKSELTTQLLFGETYQVLECQAKWVKIRIDTDGYTGWIDRKQAVFLKKDRYHDIREKFFGLIPDLIASCQSSKRTLWLPFGSRLPDYCNGQFELFGTTYQLSDNIVRENERPAFDAKNIHRYTKQFLGVPYLWGGKTLMGMDCSGFTQLIFQLFGYTLPRDTSQQIKTGKKVSLFQARCGDLVFLNNEKGQLNHVGILLEDHQVIHASGEVRIDTLDKKGLCRGEEDTYSHFLNTIQRIDLK